MINTDDSDDTESNLDSKNETKVIKMKTREQFLIERILKRKRT